VSQDSYKKTLSLRLDQIRKLEYYDNKVVFAIDTLEYHDMSFPYWNPSEIYYQDDRSRYKYRLYIALRDTQGERPDTATTSWKLMSGPHPSLFLRDTARLEDLRALLLDKHEYDKLYSFAALSFRKEKNLFPTIQDNLKDTTQIYAVWGDSGSNTYPADLMIQYYAHQLTESEKTKLKEMILQKYPYLKWGLEVLTQK
jgi:hypothetical protein